jgi:ATP phosphoribosyltransferase regulatory subunit
MLSAWLLPEHIADVLPAEARRIEELRRRPAGPGAQLRLRTGDAAAAGAPGVAAQGTGRELDLRTFKLVDQLSGRTLGLRADTTPQAARIDAHLLNREGVTRLCYCGPVLHTRRSRACRATREPLQFGAEIFGHAGLEADLEVQELALDCLRSAGLPNLVLDLATRACCAACWPACRWTRQLQEVVRRCRKDARRCAELTRGLGRGRDGAARLPGLYGGARCWTSRARGPAAAPADRRAGRPGLAGQHLCSRRTPTLRIGFDLSDMSGYAYYSGPRFAHLRARLQRCAGARRPLRRGGRGLRPQPPGVGFSLDLKALAELWPARPCRRGDPRALGRRTPRCARPCGACASRARRSSAPARPRARRRGIRLRPRTDRASTALGAAAL